MSEARNTHKLAHGLREVWWKGGGLSGDCEDRKTRSARQLPWGAWVVTAGLKVQVAHCAFLDEEEEEEAGMAPTPTT